MSKARLVITAVVVEGRSQAEVARAYGVSQPWISRLVARYRAQGETAFEARSRRPHRSPNATSADVVDRVLALRKDLSDQGLDAGPHTIAWHLQHHHQTTLSPATISRILTRHGAVTPDPAKRPKTSLRRFEADLPNETWQADFTHWHLTRNHGRGPDRRVEAEILSIIDDHSRYLIASVAAYRITGPIVVATFRQAFAQFGFPASTLTDNGMVFTTRFGGGPRGRHSRNGLETLLADHHIQQKNSTPNHPQTCGKIERVQQTLKRWLSAQDPVPTLSQLQTQLDAFRDHYNHHRPHRALGRRVPAVAYQARPKATPTPGEATSTPHARVRRDTIDATGVVTLRHHGRLHHIGIGRTHARTHVLLLIQDLDIRVINADTGELLRELVLNPDKDYQPTGQPRGPKRTKSEP